MNEDSIASLFINQNLMPHVPLDAGIFLHLKYFLFIIYTITSFYLIFRVKQCLAFCLDAHDILISIATCFFGLTLPISLFHTFDHLNSFVRPKLQSQIVRIIWMVPVFSIESLLSIIWIQYAYYFQAFREIYEAYVIYCFMRYLILYLGDERYLILKLTTLPASIGYHPPPLCFLTPWTMGQEFLRRCKAGVFQFVVIRFFLTIITLTFHMLGWHHEGDFSWKSIYIWTVGISCISQSWALYTLFLFYHSLQKDLKSIRPFYKFMSIKLIIFFSWWQALGVTILIELGHINQGHGHPAHEVAMLVEDLLISVEMLIAAVAIFMAFPVSDFSNFIHNNYNGKSMLDTYNISYIDNNSNNSLSSDIVKTGNDVIVQPNKQRTRMSTHENSILRQLLQVNLNHTQSHMVRNRSRSNSNQNEENISYNNSNIEQNEEEEVADDDDDDDDEEETNLLTNNEVFTNNPSSSSSSSSTSHCILPLHSTTTTVTTGDPKDTVASNLDKDDDDDDVYETEQPVIDELFSRSERSKGNHWKIGSYNHLNNNSNNISGDSCNRSSSSSIIVGESDNETSAKTISTNNAILNVNHMITATANPIHAKGQNTTAAATTDDDDDDVTSHASVASVNLLSKQPLRSRNVLLLAASNDILSSSSSSLSSSMPSPLRSQLQHNNVYGRDSLNNCSNSRTNTVVDGIMYSSNNNHHPHHHHHNSYGEQYGSSNNNHTNCNIYNNTNNSINLNITNQYQYHSSPSSSSTSTSVIEALWQSTLPLELQEDLADLRAQVVDEFWVQPYQYVKRTFKGTLGHE